MPRGKHSKPWYQRQDSVDEADSPRREAQRELRRKKRWAFVAKAAPGAGILVVVALVAWGVYALFSGDGGEDTVAPRENAAPVGKDSINTVLLFGTLERSPDPDARWMTLLSYDERKERGAIVYMPAHAAAEVPGRGLMGAGEALSSGGVPLLLATMENLLGIEIDSYLELSDSDARTLFDATGPISVDVPTEVQIEAGPNQAEVLFDEGPQELSSTFLRKLLYVVGLDGDEAELGARHLAFWDGLFSEFADDPAALESAVRRAEGAVGESDLDAGKVATFLGSFAALDEDDRRLAAIPATQVSVGGDELYEVDHEELVAFLESTVGTEPISSGEVRVQVLNGNGVPGIGEEVAKRLKGEDFRVILSGNARRLNYKKTLIVTYDESDAGQATAERAKDLLGVGEVQVSAQGQGIVDLTIVVGKDFVRAN
jgi:polyisoprenyl-teichoic acid--peptidoglycan teichoic acid transferase